MLIRYLHEDVTGPQLAAFIIVIVVSITVHEFAHAISAYWAGDNTPKANNRLTLNPVDHLDVVGTVLILVGGLGWGKPVLVNPANFGKRRRDDILVAFAGPLSNLLMATLFAGVIHLLVYYGRSGGSIEGRAEVLLYLSLYFVTLNVALAVFNLIPVFPLDGHHILGNLLPAEAARKYGMTFGGPWGIIVLLAIVATPARNYILGPPVEFFLGLLRI